MNNINDHIDACTDFNCDDNVTTSHCCTKTNEGSIEPYCCDIAEFVDNHFESIFGDSEHNPEHQQYEYHPIHIIPDKEIVNSTSTSPTISSTIHNLDHSPVLHRDAAQPHALGWTFIGIASGVLVLIVFVMVLLSIVYIFYRWRKKRDDRGGEICYQSTCGQEVVVYRSTPHNCRNTETSTIANETMPSCSTANSNPELNELSPPPYSSQFQQEKEGQSSERQESTAHNEKMTLQIPEP